MKKVSFLWVLILSIFSVAMIGCDNDLPPLRIYQFGPHNQGPHDTELMPEVVEACDILGVECKISNKGRGSIYLDIVDVQDGQTPGRTWGDTIGTCKPRARTSTRPRLIAHEMLHCLGVEENSPKEDNLANKFDGEDLTNKQMDQIEKGVRKLWLCRPELRKRK